MIERDIEKSLNLRGVQIHGKHPVRASGGDEVGNELCRDGVARTRLPVLTGIAEVRNDRRNAPRACPARRIDEDQKFHQIVVDGRRRRLDNKKIPAAHRLVDMDGCLPVRKTPDFRAAKLGVELFGDRFRQRTIGVARKDLDLVAVCYHVYLRKTL